MLHYFLYKAAAYQFPAVKMHIYFLKLHLIKTSQIFTQDYYFQSAEDANRA